jgi:hypothetical protein
MPRALRDFVGIHAGETAWLFGKGPTLDRFDMREAGPLRCAVNDVVRYVPECVYAFANDSIAPWVQHYAPPTVLFQPGRTRRDHAWESPAPPCELVVFEDTPSQRLPSRNPRDLADCLEVRRGTIGSAVQILWIMGVSKICCVGIDGGGGRSSREWLTEMRNDHYADYNAIRDQFIAAATMQHIDLEFPCNELRPGGLRNGNVVVRVKSGCLIGGRAYEVGDIAEVHPRDAETVIDLRLAEPFVDHPPFGGREVASLEPRREAS